jgi:hypothetical protein
VTHELDAIAIMVPTHNGPAVQIVDIALCRASTRRYADDPRPDGWAYKEFEVLDGIRAAHAQDAISASSARAGARRR